MAAGAKLLGCFWALGSTSPSERLAAAKDLLELLCTREEELQYCVERLIRGLGSNRKGARQGFSIALTELLATFPQVTAGQVLALAERLLQPARSAKAEEERGCLFGQVFALMCLLRSGRLSGKDGLQVLRQLVCLADRKVYLQQVCSVALQQAVQQLSGEVSCSTVLGELSAILQGGWEQCSPTGLYLVLALEQAYKGQEKLHSGLKELQWSDKPVMSEANLPVLRTLLHSVTDPLHVMWPAVVTAAHCSTTFSRFWKDVVSDDLCQSSTQHRCTALHLVQILMPDVAAHEVHIVLSPNLLHCLASGLASTCSDLHSAAHQLARSMCEHFSNAHSQASRVAVMLQLFGSHGFKHLRDSADVHSLMQLVEQVEANDILEYIRTIAVFLFGNETTAFSMTGKESLLEQVSLLLQPPMLHKHSHGSLVASACFLLLLTGFGGVTHPVSDLHVGWVPHMLPSSFDMEDQLSQLARQRLSAALTNIIRSGRGHSAELCFIPLRDVVLFAEDLLNSGQCAHVALSAAWKDGQQEAWHTAALHVRRFSPRGSTPLEGALCLLHVCLALQLLLEPPSKVTSGMVGELAAMQEDVTAAGQALGDSCAWCEVLTDMLLSLLCQSSLSREVASQAFRMTMPHQTRESLDLLIAVVDPRRSEELTQFVALNEEEMLDGDEGSSSGREADLGSQSEGSGISAEDDHSPDSPEVDQDFQTSVRSALGPATLELDSGDPLSDLSDDTMLQHDSALSAVLRLRLHSKGAQLRKKEEAQLLVNYQLRVLKLVEAFVKRQSSSPLLVDLIMPLVSLSYRSQSVLSSRAADIITRICKGKVPGESSAVAVTALKHAMRLPYKGVSSPEASRVLTAVAMWLLKVVYHEGQNTPAQAEALEVFRGILWDFVTKKNCTVSFGLFQALFERHGHLAWSLMNDTVVASAKAASSFRKVQCYQLMRLLLSGASPAGRDQHWHLPGVVAAAARSVMEVAGEVTASSRLNKAQLRLVTEGLLLLQTCVSVSSTTMPMIPPSVLVTVEELMQSTCYHREKLLQSTCSQLLDLLRQSHTHCGSSMQDDTPNAKRKKHN